MGFETPADLHGYLTKLRERAGLSMLEMAKRLGMKGASSWQHYERRYAKTTLSDDLIHNLVKALAGKGSPPIQANEILKLSSSRKVLDSLNLASRNGAALHSKSEIAVPEYQVRASGGGGSFVDSEDQLATWQLPESYVAGLTKHRNNLAILEVVGDSMSPTLGPGDRIMIDREDRDPTTPGIFVVQEGGTIIVKRLERVPGSKPPLLALISDNPHHGRYQVAAAEVIIAGRVVWRAQRIS